MPDDEFRVPRGMTYINFRSPEVGATAEQEARVALYTALLSDQVNEFAYPAQLAGMSFSFGKNARGITLRLAGYTDKQQLLLEQLLDYLEAPDFSPQRFENVRNDMIRKLDPALLRSNLESMIESTRAYGADVLLVAVPRPSLLRVSTADVYREVAEALQVALVDEVLADILGDPGPFAEPDGRRSGCRIVGPGTGTGHCTGAPCGRSSLFCVGTRPLDQ